MEEPSRGRPRKYATAEEARAAASARSRWRRQADPELRKREAEQRRLRRAKETERRCVQRAEETETSKRENEARKCVAGLRRLVLQGRNTCQATTSTVGSDEQRDASASAQHTHDTGVQTGSCTMATQTHFKNPSVGTQVKWVLACSGQRRSNR